MERNYSIAISRADGVQDNAGSHLFGSPYVPASLADKYVDDFIFFGQIKLSDIAELDTDGLLPHEGYLYFFVDAEMYPSDDLYVFVDYSAEEPDTLLEGFNATSPVHEGLNVNIPVCFKKAEANADCTKLLGVPSGDGTGRLLLQYRPGEFDVPFLKDLDGYLYFMSDNWDHLDDLEYWLGDLEFIVEKQLTEDMCADEDDKVLVKLYRLARENGLPVTARILRPIIEGKEMQYESHEHYKQPFIKYAGKFVEEFPEAPDKKAYYICWAADLVKALRDCFGPRESHPYYETAVRALCNEGLRVFRDLPRKQKLELRRPKKLFEITKDMHFMMGIWSEREFTEQETDYWMNPDNH